MGVYEEEIVPVKIANLAEYVSERKRVSLDEALVYVYSNPMYESLYDEGAKWWYLSTPDLYEEFERERRSAEKEVSLLHTQGTGYVLDEVQRYIDRRKKR